MRYTSYLEGEPTLESYRLCHAPRQDLAPVFICPFVVLSNERGELFNAMRGIQGQDKGSAMNMGIYRLNGELDDQCPLHVPWSEAPVSEPYWIVEDSDVRQLRGQRVSARLGRRRATGGRTGAGD